MNEKTLWKKEHNAIFSTGKDWPSDKQKMGKTPSTNPDTDINTKKHKLEKRRRSGENVAPTLLDVGGESFTQTTRTTTRTNTLPKHFWILQIEFCPTSFVCRLSLLNSNLNQLWLPPVRREKMHIVLSVLCALAVFGQVSSIHLEDANLYDVNMGKSSIRFL